MAYDPKIASEICRLVSVGGNLNRICKEPDMPSEWSVYKWLRENEEFAQEYARARETRADVRSDRIDAICQRVADGELDPQSARVIIDAEKWQAGKEQPKRYGDKLQTEHTSPDGSMTPRALDASKLSAEAMRELLAAMDADATDKPDGS